MTVTPIQRPAPRVDVAARRVLTAVETLDEAVYAAIKSGEPLDRLVHVLAMLDRSHAHERVGAYQRLAGVLNALRAHIGAALPFRQAQTFAGSGTLKRVMSGRSYSWPDGRRLAHLVAARAAEEATVDKTTGEVTPIPPAVLAGAVADALIDAGGLDNRSNSWRADSLRARGIDPDDHRELGRAGAVSAKWED